MKLKKYLLLLSLFTWSIILLLISNVYGQTTADYFLLPGDSLTLPEGSSQQFNISWIDDKWSPHEGISNVTEIPTWYLNGKESNKADPKDGKLSVSLNMSKATYTAPQLLPSQNPVIISVRFHPNDSTKEITTLLCSVHVLAVKSKWFVSYTCKSYKNTSVKSSSEDETYNSYANGSSSMVVDAPPPDVSGYVNFNAPGDNRLVHSTLSGFMTEKSSHISRENGIIIERTIRDYSGKPDRQSIGIGFEYDPQNPDNAGLNAGIDFSMNEIDKFWKWDDNSQKLKLVDSYNHTENNARNILLGDQGQKISKTKTGFLINYQVSKDTTYTDFQGALHKESSGKTYHVTINYIKSNNY